MNAKSWRVLWRQSILFCFLLTSAGAVVLDAQISADLQTHGGGPSLPFRRSLVRSGPVEQRPSGALTPVSNGEASAASENRLAVMIDGEREPERIPDDLAYRHFLSVLSQPRQPSTLQVDQRHSLLRRVGLSRSDYAAVIAALDGVREQLVSIEQEHAALSHHAVADVGVADSLRARKREVLDAARSRVVGSISPAGALLFDKYVNEEVKRRIKIYGNAPQ